MTTHDTHTTNGPGPDDILDRLGWDQYFADQLAALDAPRGGAARVLSAVRDLFLVGDGRAERLCAPSGGLRNGPRSRYPVTGDWVLADDGVITRVLPRKTILCRGEAGARGRRDEAATREQPMGANIDTVFIVCGLDRDFNLRRLERYLTLVYSCRMAPVIVLTKADLHQDPEAFAGEAEAIAFGVPVVLASMLDDRGADELAPFLASGRTVAMLGSSGAGKSTLANMLHGSDVQATAAVSASLGKGRHTTTARELIRMPQGGMLMDNPGIREIAFSADGGGLDASFPDIQALAEGCRFADCTHLHEPGCAVVRAAECGELPTDRLESFRKMQREMDYLAARSGKSADRVEKERWRDVAQAIRRMKKRK